MPRRPDVPCSGCGKLIWGGRGALPAGEATCRPCRKSRSEADRTTRCPVCRGRFVSDGGATCSRTCGRISRRRTWEAKEPSPVDCPGCGVKHLAMNTRARCEDCKTEARRTKKRRHRARDRSVAHEPYTLREIAERDQFRCGICRRPVRMDLVFPEYQSPTIDHIVPVSEGGDDIPPNVRLAHFICNTRRGTGKGEVVQLALV